MVSPFTPHTDEEITAMLDAIGVESQQELFDIPREITFDGTFGIDQRSEQEITDEVHSILERNNDRIEFLGRGHYAHYGPAMVDDIAGRSEFLTSYTQYQPEVAQGFLQALFEYQSMFVELTGLEVVNSSMYDGATALGEAATLAARVRETTGDSILIPEHIHPGRRSVLENYVSGAGMTTQTYAMDDGIADVDDIREQLSADVAMVYLANPSVRGVIEENIEEIATLTHDHDAVITVSSDPVALGILEPPGSAGADIVIGDAGVLGLPVSYGTGLGLFATRERFLRQVPGRLVGASTDEAERRAFTLTLQTREQHIRRERATSNICTNQAWVALRTAMHLAWLGPHGLVDVAQTCVESAQQLAAELDEITGITAPYHDRYHFREFVAETDRPAEEIVAEVDERGYAIHAIDSNLIQICVTETTAKHQDGLVTALAEVA